MIVEGCVDESVEVFGQNGAKMRILGEWRSGRCQDCHYPYAISQLYGPVGIVCHGDRHQGYPGAGHHGADDHHPAAAHVHAEDHEPDSRPRSRRAHLQNLRRLHRIPERVADISFSVTFLMIEKSPKDLADGKCSCTSPLPPTVGIAFARIIMASCKPAACVAR